MYSKEGNLGGIFLFDVKYKHAQSTSIYSFILSLTVVVTNHLLDLQVDHSMDS